MAAWLLLCALLLPVNVALGASDSVDLDKPCTVTVHPSGKGDEAFADDVLTAKVRVDLYRVAEAKPLTGRDGFSLQPVAPFEGLTISQYAETDEWEALARAAGDIVLNDLESMTPAASAMTGTPISGLKSGLYVMIAHGDDIDAYVETVDGVKMTLAQSATHTYRYAPELVVLPTKELEEGSFSSASDWQYDFSVTLKPEQGDRFGDLQVIKNLLTHPEGQKATFVFSVTVGEEPAKVYSLDFNAPGQDSFFIRHLPAGTQVVVTEIYSGASYRLITPKDQTATIIADDLVSVSFTNEYEPTGRNGYGILNRFTYAADGWQWTKGGGAS